MNFEMNNNVWKIKRISKQYLVDRYNSEHDEKCYYAFGLTDYAQHIIYLNEEMCYEQQKKTLLHELMHCYLWEYGICDFTQFNEEDLCNFSASSHYIIHNIMKRYFEVNVIELDDEK